MSGITPILDTLLHQVLGKRVDIPVVKDQPLPVSAATSSDAIQPARSDSRLHQQGGERVTSAAASASREGAAGSTGASSSAGIASARIHLSQTATQIADILARFPATQSASIRPLAALLQPGAGADSLAQALSQSVRDSGVFYESHLQRWASGQYPLKALMREPQAWLGLTFRPSAPDANSSLLSTSAFALWGSLRDSPLAANRHMAKGVPPDEGAILESSRKADASSRASVREHQLSQPASDSLQTLVRHQLELIVSPNLRWEGQLWPGVPMTLLLSELPGRDADRDAADGAPHRSPREIDAAIDEWRADVQIRLPSLGLIDLAFRTRREGPLSVEIEPSDDIAKRQMEPRLALLQERLIQLGVNAEASLATVGQGEAEDE